MCVLHVLNHLTFALSFSCFKQVQCSFKHKTFSQNAKLINQCAIAQQNMLNFKYLCNLSMSFSLIGKDESMRAPAQLNPSQCLQNTWRTPSSARTNLCLSSALLTSTTFCCTFPCSLDHPCMIAHLCSFMMPSFLVLFLYWSCCSFTHDFIYLTIAISFYHYFFLSWFNRDF